MKYPCVESTFDIEIEDNKVLRLWVDRDGVIPEPEENEGFVEQIKSIPFNEQKSYIENIIREVPRLNAVQLLVQHKGYMTGTVVYTVDFEDTKG